MKDKQNLKTLPKLMTDKQAEDFVAQADLSEYDFSGFKSMKFEFASKLADINDEPLIIPGSKKEI